MAEVIWTIRAYEHMFEIGEYISKDSSFQAKRVIQLIVKETRRLEGNIRIGQITHEIQNDRYRELRVFSYRILYKILSEEKVAIIGIVHSKRALDPESLE
jgi:plasmid stabilization system protein ParE